MKVDTVAIIEQSLEKLRKEYREATALERGAIIRKASYLKQLQAHLIKKRQPQP